jgi:23S rRNA (pseudouridine1915-N3)-methyltransferase
MRLRVASIGQRMPAWVQAGWTEYARRMPRELTLELQEVAPRKRGRKADLAAIRRDEGQALLAAVPDGYRIIALDGGGQPWSTGHLASRLLDWMGMGTHCAFLVGGPEGLDSACLQAASESWSLGPLTLPHPLVRVVLAEQVYRAWTMNNNHPYHRA